VNYLNKSAVSWVNQFNADTLQPCSGNPKKSNTISIAAMIQNTRL
jgi:hypothetical protein